MSYYYYPNRASTLIISNYNGRRFVKPRDMGIEISPPHTLFLDMDSLDCWQDPEEFWAMVDKGYGPVPMPWAWQPFYSDLDSQATSIILTESSQPEQSEEGTVTVDASLSRNSSLVSDTFSDDSHNMFFRRQCKDTDPPCYFEVRTAANVLDFHLPSEDICNDLYVESSYDSDKDLPEDHSMYDWIACGYQVASGTVQQCNRVQATSPSIEELGDPSNVNNYLPDSGATQHMTPRQANLYDAVEGQKLGVEVADGHIIQCSTTGKVKIVMTDDNGRTLTAELHGCMYIPGLSRRLFSITKFASNG